jgi:uncharacterized membrane protein
MAFCRACGQDAGEASFCPKCGAPQGAAVAAPVVAQSAAPSSEGIDENVAGLLCYVFWWVSGLIFLLIDKRPFVKFHAAQDIAFNIAMCIVAFAFWMVALFITFITTAIFHFPFGFLMVLLWPVIGITFLGTWIFLMYKAYNHEKFKLPIIGDMVEKMIGQ